jgi:hypothetical protein
LTAATSQQLQHLPKIQQAGKQSIEALAQRRFKYNYICQDANQHLRDRFTFAEMEASNERVRRQLYDGNLEPTRTPKVTEIPAYTKFLKEACEQYKDVVAIDE